MKKIAFSLLSAVILVAMALPAGSGAVLAQPSSWPDDANWTYPTDCYFDPQEDEHPDWVDLVGNETIGPAAYYYFGTDYAFFRERVIGDPSGPGNFSQSVWLVLFDLPEPGNYEYLLSMDGKDEKVQLWNNTVQESLVWAPILKDEAEQLLQEYPAGAYARIVADGTGCWFVDWAFPLSVLGSYNITANTTIYFCTSADANNYNKDYLDCYEPDLAITEKSEAWVSLVNKTYNVSYTVCNNGAAALAGASNTTVTIDDVDVLEDPVPELAAGECYNSTVGPFTMSGTNDTIMVCADNGDVVDESNEDNNCMNNTFIFCELPVADFSVDDNSTCVNTSVNFTDLSTGQIDSWSWDFGDGSNSSTQHPTHQYSSAGTYTVNLTVSNAYGSDDESKSGYITVIAPCVATAPDFSICVNTTLDDQLFIDNGANCSASCNMTLDYSGVDNFTVGNYSYNVTCGNGVCNDAEATGTVTVGPGSIGDLVWADVDGNGTKDSGEFGIANITISLLDVSDRSTIATTATDANGYYLFPNLEAGAYIVDVDENDDDMPAGYFTTTYNDPMNISLAACEHFLDADFGFGHNPDGIIGDYVWVDANADGVQDPEEIGIPWIRVVLKDESGETFLKDTETDSYGNYFFYDNAVGTYRVELDLTDPDLAGYVLTTSPWVIAVIASNFLDADFGLECEAPTAAFSANVTGGCTPLTVNFTDLSTGNPTGWSWDFPGGTPSSASTQGPQIVTYDSAGNYTVNLTVSNACGSDTKSETNYITVEDAIERYNLTISSTSGGSVTTPGEATYSYNASEVVDLVAAPDANYHFVNWTGDVGTLGDANSATTNITMNGNYSIVANFAIDRYDLSISSTSGGNVTTSGEGVSTHDAGTVVDLVATPDANYHFVNWTGNVGTMGDANSATTNITMDGDYSIVANFAIDRYNLTISSTSGGNVTTPGEGVSTHDAGTVVDLVATADANYHFVNWTGNVGTMGDANSATTNITMNGNYSIVAKFAIDRYNLTVNVTPSGGGNVTVNGATPPDYPNTTTWNCSENVTLNAVAAGWYSFVNWSGDLSGNTTPRNITMYDNYTITANFINIATLVGNVTFEERDSAPDARWIEPFVVHFFQNGNETAWAPITATTNTTGFFTITGLTPGTYDIGIKNCTCLSEMVFGTVLPAGGSTYADFGTSREGDCNEDDMVGAKDRGLLYDGWNSFNIIQDGHLCDLNRDGMLNSQDRGLMYDNWHTTGDVLLYLS